MRKNKGKRGGKNIYTDTTYYFLSCDIGPGKRVVIEDHNALEFSHTVSSYDAYLFFEEDLINLVNTGRQMFGESFAFDPYQTFQHNLEYLDLDKPIKLSVRVAAKSSNTSSFVIKPEVPPCSSSTTAID